MMPRRRPHPARRVRRWIGASCAALYLTLTILVGLHERRPAESSELITAPPEPGAATPSTTVALATTTAAFSPPTTAPNAPEGQADSSPVPRPAPAPRESGFATTTRPPTTAAPTTSVAPPTTAPVTSAPPTTAAPTVPPTTSLAPTTTIYIAAS